MPPLDAAALVSLRSASAEEVQTVCGDLGVHISGGSWLGETNRYATDTINIITRDSGMGIINHSDLAQYIVASAVPHCVDGWSYVGRAMDAIARGDASACR